MFQVYVVCSCTEFFGEVGHFTERSGFQLCVICEKLMVYRVVSYDIERRSVQDVANGPPVLSPEAHRT